MRLKGVKVGIAVTGSFCTLNSILDNIKELCGEAESVTAVFSECVQNTDTRFGTALKNMSTIEDMTGNKSIRTITQAERVGPGNMFDVLAVAPCTGNSLSKIALGITDNTVTMAVKSHLRNLRPVVIGVSSNDILGANAKNLGILLNASNIYFIPFYQDDPVNKENSVTFKPSLIAETILKALAGKQIQPILSCP